MIWRTSWRFTAGSITMSSMNTGTFPFFSVTVLMVSRSSARVSAT